MSSSSNYGEEWRKAEREEWFKADKYSEYEGALYHRCEKLRRYNPYTKLYEIGRMPFSIESKEWMTHCPICKKKLNWDTDFCL